jgi:uncharacterized membrane protein YgdD (TMEM256/DUF423 family)
VKGFRRHEQVLRWTAVVFTAACGVFIGGLTAYLITDSVVAYAVGGVSFIVGLVVSAALLRYAQRRSEREYLKGLEQIDHGDEYDNEWWDRR